MAITECATHYIGKVEFELIDIRDPLEKIRQIQMYREDAHFELDEPELDRAKKYLAKREQQVLSSLQTQGGTDIR